jgi:hypothetical protein
MSGILNGLIGSLKSAAIAAAATFISSIPSIGRITSIQKISTNYYGFTALPGVIGITTAGANIAQTKINVPSGTNAAGSAYTFYPNGDPIWPVGIYDTTNSILYSGFTLGDSSNLVVQAAIVKLTSSLTYTSGFVLTDDTLSGGSPRPQTKIADIKLDSTGNIYVSGECQVNGQSGFYGFITKINSSGVIQWQRKVISATVGAPTCVIKNITLDSSGNVYCVGNSNTGGGTIYKYNSSGALQWQRGITGPAGSGALTNIFAVALDAAGSNVYVTGYTQFSTGPTVNKAYIVKYNSSGTIQWQRYFLSSSFGGGLWGSVRLTTDSSSNVYITGSALNSGNQSYLLKYDSTGAFQFARNFNDGAAAGSKSMYISSSTTDSTNIILGGIDSTNAIAAVLPLDGTHTGTAQGITYSTDSTFTDSAGTLTDSAGTSVDSAGVLTSSALTFSVTSQSNTVSTTTI